MRRQKGLEIFESEAAIGGTQGGGLGMTAQRTVKRKTVESSENVRFQGQAYRIAPKSETDVSYGKQP